MEKNFKKMTWPCKSCMLSDDPNRNQNFRKPLQDFGVRWASDFITKLLPQGAWARCISCQDDRRGALGAELGGEKNNLSKEARKAFGHLGGEFGGNTNNISKEKRKELGGKLGGNNNNEKNNERCLASAQACEACAECGRMLPRAQYWPGDWRHRTSKAIAYQKCFPVMPLKRPRGGNAANQQRAAEADGKPITCKICRQTLPRSHFRPGANGKFKLSKGLTCEQCRAEGNLDKGGRKRKFDED
mgnify:CR=1 FL=1